MNLSRLNLVGVALLAVVGAAAALAVERVFEPEPGGSLMLTMVFWLAVAEGCVAVMAAAEVAHATWHLPIRRAMNAAHAMIPAMAAFFLVVATQLSIYPWHDRPGVWLAPTFFVVRHLVMFLIVFGVARRFVVTCEAGDDRRRLWGVLYAILFMIHQSMIGFEWVMSLEKPWFSTLFGAWFMVDAFLSGICAAAVLLFCWRRRFDDALRYAQKSIGGLMFGFATFWAYFYFSQLIVIWYGNIPEETHYLAVRIGYHTPYWFIARAVFAMCWVIPFAVLLGRAPKRRPGITLAMALVILAGFLLEKWLMIHVSLLPDGISVPASAVDFVLLGALFVSVMRSRDTLLPAAGAAAMPGAEARPVHA